MNQVQEFCEIIKNYDDIVVTAHANPDGDALGSTFAMGYILQKLNKRFCLYNVSGIPAYLEWLEFPAKFYTSIYKLPFRPKLYICLDCADIWRLGNELPSKLQQVDSINIDHHLDNGKFANKLNYVDPKMAATGQMVAAIAKELCIKLEGQLAEYIYTSLSADTGNFRFPNTNYEVLALVAEMAKDGLDVSAVHEKMDNQWTLTKIKLWGLLFKRIRLEADGQIAICCASVGDLHATGSVKSELDFFAEFMRSIKGVKVAAFLREDPNNKVKLSMRSQREFDVREIAARFGGGGHKNASGANIDAKMLDAEELVIKLISDIL